MKPQLTKEAFAEFCESKPADEEYNYTDPMRCAFCQYLVNRGFPVFGVGSSTWADNTGIHHKIPDGIDSATRSGMRTFGALAARLRS